MRTLFQELLTSVPEYNHYLTGDEMHKRIDEFRSHPGFIIETIGHSMNALPIEMLRYDRGYDRSVLLWGFEDPTEPVCALSMFWLCEQLRLQSSPVLRFECNWGIIPTINPDGLQLNEEWFSAPGDMHAFLRGAWQPPDEQILYWNPSLARPEMSALHHAITTIKPDVLFDMHDESHFPAPGYQVFLSSPIDSGAIADHLAYATAQGMPLLDAPIMDPALLRNPDMSVAMAYTVRPDCFVLIDEVCGYATSMKADDSGYCTAEKTTVLQTIDSYLVQLDNISPC